MPAPTDLTTVMLRAADDETACVKPETNAQGLPEDPMQLCGSSASFFSQLIQYTTYFALAVAFASGVLLMTMIVADKNRGEAGIATSDHTRIFKFALGCCIIASAFVLARGAFAVWN